MLCAGGDGSAALLIKAQELGSAEPTTAVSFPRAPFSTVAIEKSMIVIQNKNILCNSGNYIDKFSTLFYCLFVLSRKDSRRGAASLSAWREGHSIAYS